MFVLIHHHFLPITIFCHHLLISLWQLIQVPVLIHCHFLSITSHFPWDNQDKYLYISIVTFCPSLINFLVTINTSTCAYPLSLFVHHLLISLWQSRQVPVHIHHHFLSVISQFSCDNQDIIWAPSYCSRHE